MLHETIIQIRDESNLGETYHQTSLKFQVPKVTVREIISERVRMEVDQYNSKANDHFHGLVQPTDAEKTLNGFRLKKRRFIDPDKQIAIALKAFETNGFFMLIDDNQAESLEEEITLRSDMVISFIKLTQLVGG